MRFSGEQIAEQVKGIEVLMAAGLDKKPLHERVHFLIKEKGYNYAAVGKALKLNGKQVKALVEEHLARVRGTPTKDKEGEETEAEKRGVTVKDLHFEDELRKLKVDARLPITEKEILDSAYWHNMQHFVGKHTLLEHIDVLKNMKPEERDDWTKAAPVVVADVKVVNRNRDRALEVDRLEANVLAWQVAYATQVVKSNNLSKYLNLALSYMSDEQREIMAEQLMFQGLVAMKVG